MQSAGVRSVGGLAALCLSLVLVLACGQRAGAPASAPAAPAAPAAPESSAPAGQPAAPAAPVAIRTAYTTAGASMAALWLADETGAFKEQGLDAEVAFIGAGQAILGALSSQEAPIVLAGANQVIEANLQGGQYVLLGAAMPYLTNSIYVSPDVQTPDDLRGKSIGVSNFGAISHVALKIALEHWGLTEGRDVQVVRSGGTPETLAAMQTGAIAGGSFSPPQTFRARDLGFRELIDVAALKVEMGSAAIVSTRAYVAAHSNVVERYLKALIRGAHAFKTQKDPSVESIMVHTKLDDRATAEDTWEYYRGQMSDDMAMSPRGVENNLRFIADDKPEARNARPEQFLDSSFTDKIKASGYVEQVTRGS
ncbi:MAG TPA: ABC transporter substrate-binding protein [Chloroflexota bacterium]|nr:ABC transporter substrate-binding protein [Chloroflexota bacterium]